MTLRITINDWDEKVVRHHSGRELPIGDRVSWQAPNGSYHTGEVVGISESGWFVKVKTYGGSKLQEYSFTDLEYVG